MLHLIVGPTGSGKSEYAERLMAGYLGRTVYVGTLPQTRAFKAVIKHHKARRPAHWELIELARDPHADLKVLDAALSSFQNVFVDGLTYYLFRIMTLFGDNLNDLRVSTKDLIYRAASHDGQVIVVDTPVYNTLPEEECRVLRYLHLQLARSARNLTLFENGIARPLSRYAILRGTVC